MARHSVQRLYQLTQKKSMLVLGLMSGTSLDGLDMALCRITGTGENTRVRLLHGVTLPYTENFKNNIRRVFAKNEISFLHLSELHQQLARWQGDKINHQLKKWKVKNSSVDLIASHGQTVFHSPKNKHSNATLHSTFQIGDGDQLAYRTGIIVVSDFRQKDIAQGGEGAPLAGYGDFLLFAKKRPCVLLNIGGIANATVLHADKKIISTDLGPGNTLLDAYVHLFFQKPYDKNGQLAAKGKVDDAFLNSLKRDDFFHQRFPISTGQEYFNRAWVEKKFPTVLSIKPHDVLRTLTQLTADTIVKGIRAMGADYPLIVSGGGVHHTVLMDALKKQIAPQKLYTSDAWGIPTAFKEAIFFAALAHESIAGDARYFLPNQRTISFGKISLPD